MLYGFTNSFSRRPSALCSYDFINESADVKILMRPAHVRFCFQCRVNFCFNPSDGARTEANRWHKSAGLYVSP